MSSEFRGRRLLAVVSILVAIGIALPRFVTHTPYQRLGVRLDSKTVDGIPIVGDVVGPPARGVLEKGDRIVELEGRPFTEEERRARLRDGGLPRGPLRVTIERGGRTLGFVLPPLQLGLWQRVRLYTAPLAAVIAAPLVAFLLVWRRPDLNAAWVFLWFAALQGLGTIWSLFRFPQLEPDGGLALYLRLYHALVYFFPASFLHFMTVFPRPRWPHRRPWQSIWFWLVTLAYLAPPVLWLVSRTTAQPMDELYLHFQTVALTLGTLSLVARYAWPGAGDRRPERSERVLALLVAGALLAGTAFEAVAQDPRVMAMFSMPLVRVAYTVILFSWLASPLVIAFLIANDPVFDPRRLVLQSLPYAALSGVLAALYLGIVVVSQRLFATATGEEAVLFNVVAALIVAFAFAPFRDRVQQALDRLYGRDPKALRQALDRAGHELLGALTPAEVEASVESGLSRGLKRHVAVEWTGGVPRLAADERVPDDARPAIENVLLQAGTRLENLGLQEQRAAAERQSVELREAATRAELRALHAQVQPHFLFNALNALSYLTETDPPAAQRFTERLADMLRYTVEAGERPAALLSEELGFVEDYLGVARERYENPLDFRFQGAPELLSAAVPPLLLQPLVENSLKHGCAPGQQALHLHLDARREDGWMTLTFADDGVSNANGGPSLGVGLQNLEQRVRRFAGPQASMSAGPRREGGFAVTLRWPAAHANGVAK